MAVVKVDQFCSLATSASWQAWLYHYNKELYRYFIEKLRLSKNCSSNSELMKDVLQQINESDTSGQLYDFLRTNHPHVLIDDYVKKDNVVFKNYVHGVLTYPHRIILSDNNINNLRAKIRQMSDKKFRFEYVIVDNDAYIEYLDYSEKDMVHNIPSKNWLVLAYKRGQNG